MTRRYLNYVLFRFPEKSIEKVSLFLKRYRSYLPVKILRVNSVFVKVKSLSLSPSKLLFINSVRLNLNVLQLQKCHFLSTKGIVLTIFKTIRRKLLFSRSELSP